MVRSVSTKMGIKPNTRAIFIGAPADAIQTIKLPNLMRASQLRGEFDYIHFFAKKQTELHKKFSSLKKHLKPLGMLWVSWPKSKQLNTDLTITIVIKIGYDYGLVESKALSIDATWSGLKFTHPKEGKEYNNKYGILKK
jgi:hypothetical protein